MTAAIGDRYRKAAELGPQRLFSLMRNRIIEPRWTGEGDAFTYVRQAETGATETVLIDPEAGSRVILPTQEQKPVPAGSRILSPDGKREVLRKGHDLALRDVATGEETVLLDGGEPFFAWGRLVDNSMVHLLLKPIVDTLAPVFTGFSPSGRYVFSARVDERAAPSWPFVEHLPADGHRPRLHEIRGLLQGEGDDSAPELAFVDLTDGSRCVVPLEPTVVHSMVSNGTGAFTWSKDENTVYVFSHSTGQTTASILTMDVRTGQSRIAVSETDTRSTRPTRSSTGFHSSKCCPRPKKSSGSRSATAGGISTSMT